MEKCCEPKVVSEVEPKREMKGHCPECGKEGKPVQRLTLENLLKNISGLQDAPYWFCPTFECPVVYFSMGGSSIFHKSELKVRVGIKEKEDPIPLCYCFGWDRERICSEIKRTGGSTAVESISKEVKAGNCFCERSNPQGTCCLVNVSKAVKEGFAVLGKESL